MANRDTAEAASTRVEMIDTGNKLLKRLLFPRRGAITNNYNGLQRTATGVKMIKLPNIPQCVKAKGSPYSITERRVPELIPVLGSQPAGDVSHKPGGRLPLLSARPAVTPQPLRGLLPISLLGEERQDGCEQFA